jgi:hypothetical protein
MDLYDLEQRTGLGRRLLRYVLDHALVPELDIEISADAVGRPRKFHDDVGFGIVCAAQLLNLGLPHKKIQLFLQGILGIQVRGKGSPKNALLCVLERPADAKAYLGDGANVRIVVDEYSHDSGWQACPGHKPPPKGYEPLVTVVLDLGRIRETIFSPH